jgi:hypothetical protein
MIEELLKAIVAYYRAATGATLRTLLGDSNTEVTRKLWYAEAPQGTGTPYITFMLVASPTEFTMAQDLPYPRVQFDIWHDSSDVEDVITVADSLRDTFNSKLLTLGGSWSMLRADPVGHGRVMRDGDEGWHAVVEYDFVLEKSR